MKTVEIAQRRKTAELLAESAAILRALDAAAHAQQPAEGLANRVDRHWLDLLLLLVNYALLISLGSALGVLLALALEGAL